MDAKERLKRFLEQRREMGEKELVLDGMSVDEALKLLGAAAVKPGVGKGRPEPRPATGVPEFGKRSPDPVADAPPAGPVDSSASRVAEQGAKPSRPASPMPRTTADVAGASELGLTERFAAESARRPPTSAPKPEVEGGTPPLAIIQRLETLDLVAEATRHCNRCPLYTTAINAVPGEGNPDADFMIIGEAPGQTEDETGRPFVGAAGQLLTKILGAINLERQDVFIANVLKHRPPGNRNPKPDEVAACSPYLLRQLELVRPKVILALGTFAAQTLLDTKTPIGKLRGEVHRYHGVPLVVTYHPAALLRNPAWKRPTWEDVQLARRILDDSSAGA